MIGIIFLHHRILISLEEKFLREKFGRAYSDYTASVPRWISFKAFFNRDLDWKPAADSVSSLRNQFPNILKSAAAVLILFFALAAETESKQPYRFVLFQPDAGQVEISGSFTGWKPTPMRKTGLNGYWETTLELDHGEHRFNYIIEGRDRIPDPTIIIREKDDFGGINSILKVGTAI